MQKLYKKFPNITKGLNELINISFSFKTSLEYGGIYQLRNKDCDDAFIPSSENDEDYNVAVISAFIANSLRHPMNCKFETSLNEDNTYFRYVTSGGLGFCFRQNPKDVTFTVWKSGESENKTLTSCFSNDAGWSTK